MPKRIAKLLVLTVTAGVLLLGGSGCMSQLEHKAQLTAIDQSRRVSDEERLDWAATIAGDNDKDGQVTEADGPRNMTPLEDLLRAHTVAERDLWLRARRQSYEEYRALIDQQTAPSPVP